MSTPAELQSRPRTDAPADDDAFVAVAGGNADGDGAAGMRDAALTAQTRPAIEVLDDVYAEPHSSLARQRERFAAYLDGFADEEA